MKLYQYMIIVILIVVILTAFSSTYSSEGGLADTYNITIDEEFQEIYSNHSSLQSDLQEITSITTNMTDNTITTKQLDNDFSDPSKALINVLKMTYQGFDLVKGFILGVGQALHLDPIIIMGGVAILLIGLLFAMLSAIFRYQV